MSDFQLNSALDISALAAAYSEKKRLHIPAILAPESAERLYNVLTREIPWGFAYSDGGPKFHRAEDWAAMSKDQRDAILVQVNEQAANGFQYSYDCYPMLDAYLQGWGQVPSLDRFLDFINSPTVLDFVRKLTGRPDIIKGDAQATRYGPGQFLKFHTDDVTEEYRVAAFVFNFTPKWDPDWGGLLQFYNQNWDVTDALLPRFNALNVFTVPQNHAVSYVADYAAGHRYAITGWFRYK